LLGGKFVGLEFVSSGGTRIERLHKEGEHRRDQHEQHERCVRRRLAHPEGRIKPGLFQQPAEQGKPRETRHGQHCETFGDVVTLEVTKLMRQDGFYLAGAQRREQRVEKHNSFGAPKTGEIGVAMGGAA